MLKDSDNKLALEGLSAESKEILEILRTPFEEEKDSTIKGLRGEEAQRAVDIMQDVSVFASFEYFKHLTIT